jgi:hypothetical protein
VDRWLLPALFHNYYTVENAKRGVSFVMVLSYRSHDDERFALAFTFFADGSMLHMGAAQGGLPPEKRQAGMDTGGSQERESASRSLPSREVAGAAVQYIELAAFLSGESCLDL